MRKSANRTTKRSLRAATNVGAIALGATAVVVATGWSSQLSSSTAPTGWSNRLTPSTAAIPGTPETNATPSTSTYPVRDGLPVDVEKSWWQAVTSDLSSAEYAATATSTGLQAPNRAHDLRTTFHEQGIAVEPRVKPDVAPPWQFAWETSAFGRTDHMNAVAPVSPTSEGVLVTYHRDGWSEWYENTPKGVEQGFTIERKPAGNGPLRIAGRFPASMMAVAREDGGIDFLDANGACAIRYGALYSWDANGVTLASELVVSEDAIEIVVHDQSAAYPLTIDPLMTSPAWTAESNQAGALMGFSVATAGDVNGDGFSDVIVGAWGYDNGESNEGRALVYHGSPSGLSVAPNWTAESNQANALFGFSVATAGDINGDGFDDVIVGAWSYDGGQTDEGRAYVYHGSPSGLSPSPNWTAEGDQTFAQYGTRVATAGDVDADGFDDVIVGAPFFDGDLSDEGRAFVYRGSAGGLSTTPFWTAEGNQTGVQFGNTLATAGDVNGDGFADVIVGAVVFSNGQANEGRAFVFHGSPGGPSATPNWTAESNQVNAYFATSVAAAGDVNGDGYGDVIVGSPGYQNGQSGEGRAFVYHGAAGGLSGTAAWTWEPNLGDSAFGQSVGTAGDINGDGFADVIVGAHNFANGQFAEGRAFVFQGARLGLWSFAAWTAESNQASAGFGISVATAGDINGDGFSDVIVGAWSFDNGQSDEGRAFVYHGSAGGLQAILQWAVEGEASGDIFGYSLATAGDVNGDGYSDVIVGDYGVDNGQNGEGMVVLFYGSATGLSFTPGWIAESDQTGAAFGVSVASAGDVNGDGFSDVIIGAPFFDGGQSEEGRVFVYLGSPAGLGASPAWIAESNEEDHYFGMSVATAGDVNGDGFSDVIVGAPGFVYLNAPLGWAYVYHGSASGLSSTPNWTVDGGQTDSNFGISVASAGDVNGDGFSEVIVGASYYDNGQGDEGRAFLYHGSTSGLSLTPNWTAESDKVTANFGCSVASAGDVNGDGFSDAIVGALFYNDGQDYEGRATVYHGSATGLGIANWTADGNQENSYFGASVATAGDVNGDGFSDVIVGSPEYDGAFLDQGRALIYHGSSIGLSSAPAKTVEIAQADADLGRAVATAGDVNGDGYSDILIGAPRYDGAVGNGLAISYFGNENDGLDRIPQQWRANNSAPISILGTSDSPSAFLLKALGRTPRGRDSVRLEFEVKPFGVAFDGSAVTIGDTFDTGAPSSGIGSAVQLAELVGGLTDETLYHWRLRIASDSPFFPRSPWFGAPGNAAGEADLRTARTSTDVADQDLPVPGGVVLDPVRPNPFQVHGEIAYTLPVDGDVKLSVYDAAGRQVAVLSDEARVAGHHSVRWQGRDAGGNAVPDGVYFVRLETERGVASQKVVVTR